ncbi:NAD-dependent epimerase/dehydratase family protein [Rhizobium sp. BK068]|uniref:NAD-dependent epimerase/dehydratase family protein n=1 Tax=Rhizobium sp. BK068 TaxID=2512130 RepID=UPI001050BFF6|nr:NAD-dependent epimerase/dehydratase family protein [Rhizobium sp. BK068]TCM63885.1 nucleoside-diphosphate-sugar epimerase [Rhizobium sp. BK068]
MIFVVGGNGRLGRAINAYYGETNTNSLAHSVYQDWWMPTSSNEIRKYFEPWAHTNSIIYIASGLLDPALDSADLMKVNYHLPMNIMEGVAGLGIRAVTFGTVLETLFLGNGNHYVQSKRALCAYVEEAASDKRDVAHLRLHTLYGIGEPAPFMFLGLVFNALRSRAPFGMTLGRQLREYHHFTDEAAAIHRFTQDWKPGVTELNHGQPVTLKDIATTLFSAFDAESLLKVGALPEPAEENYEKSFQKPEFLVNCAFRDTLPGVVEYIESCLTAAQAKN